MRIRYFGHSAFQIIGEKNVVVDPYIVRGDVEGNVDFIFVTHAHSDHLGIAVELSRRFSAPIVCMFDLAQHLNKKGVKTIGMNYGPADLDGLSIVMTPAWHSSSFEGQTIGNACGFIIEDVYHAGDTFVFSDMALLRELYRVRVALLPIGGFFTMGPREAAKAVELIDPEYVIPMHYNTFPLIRRDPEEFRKLVGDKAEVVILEPGEEVEI